MGPITRDEQFPAEAGQLVAMLNQCCEGFTVDIVVMAMTNMHAAALNAMATAAEMGDAERLSYVHCILVRTMVIAEANWKRTPQPSDIPVRAS